MMPTFAELAGIDPPEHIDGISMVPALMGKQQPTHHAFLYWDYGHCRERYDQAVRYGHWKGIREGLGGEIQIYDLKKDIGEEHNLADLHPDVVRKIDSLMKSAFVPDDCYEVG